MLLLLLLFTLGWPLLNAAAEAGAGYGTPAATFTGEAEGDYLTPVSGIGDVNGDGYDDIAIGAAGHSSNTGRVTVYLGSASGVSATSDTALDGDEPGDLFGRWVSGAGDVNGDGYDDLIVGAYGRDDMRGCAMVYLGSSAGLSEVPSVVLEGTSSGDYFGFSVSGAGDVDGDGYDDVLVGAYDAEDNWGRTYLYYGSISGISSDDVTILSGEAGDKEQFGWSVSGAGDVNADGYDDVVVGAIGLGGGYDYDYGRAYVFHGSAGGISTSSATALKGAYVWDGYGYSVSGAGDVDGDGYDDVVVGVYYFYYDGSRGRALVYSGSPSGISSSGSVLPAVDGDDSFGVSVSGTGDINGDGYDDLIVGAPGHGDWPQGQSHVYLGADSGIVTTPTTTLTGEFESDDFGYRVSGAGDVNADGYDDFLVGALGYEAYTGRVYLYFSNVDSDADGIMSVDDCADDDAATYPGADEVACDCVDQDCDGEDLREGCDAGDTGCDEDTGVIDTGAADTSTDTDSGDSDSHSGDSSTDPSDSDAHDTAPHDTDAHPDSGEAPDSPASDDSAAPDTGKDASTCGCATPQATGGAPLTALLALIVSRRRSGRRAGSGSA